MKILCAKSGLLFKTEHVPFFSDTATISHPIFSLPQKKLFTLVTGKWATGELTQVDSYLLFLALLNSSENVEFRTHAVFTQETPALVANNMEILVKVIGALNVIKHPGLQITQIAITKENNTLGNVAYWIQNWQNNIAEFQANYREYKISKDLNRREDALEKLIKSPHKEIQLATQIAEWAEIAGSFPQFICNSPFGEMPLSHYWKLIIRKCINAESIFSVPTKDIQELIDHCEDTIHHGSIYAHTLMKILRNGREKQNNFLGLGDLETFSQPFIILNSEDSVENANLQLLIQTAPEEEPIITNYPSRFEWLKAHTKWKIAEAHKLSLQPSPKDSSQNETNSDL